MVIESHISDHRYRSDCYAFHLKKSYVPTIFVSQKQSNRNTDFSWNYLCCCLYHLFSFSLLILHFSFSLLLFAFCFSLSLSLSLALYSYSNLVQSDFLSDSSNLVRTDGPHTHTHMHIRSFCDPDWPETHVASRFTPSDTWILYPSQHKRGCRPLPDPVMWPGDQQVSRAADRCGNNLVWIIPRLILPLLRSILTQKVCTWLTYIPKTANR